MANSAVSVERDGSDQPKIPIHSIGDLLLEGYGYSKARALLTGQQSEKGSMFDFFKGTILGTYDPQLRKTLEAREATRDRGDSYPRIAAVRASKASDADELPWQIKNGTLFGERDGDSARKLLSAMLRPFFPVISYGVIPAARRDRVPGWKFQASRPDAVLVVKKDLSRGNVDTEVRFRASIELVKEINEIVTGYRQFLATRS